jgi:uncharacterized protein (TIGR02466 family)
MTEIQTVFVTRLYRAVLDTIEPGGLNDDLDAACASIALDDIAGQRWCEKNGYPGYTSYASLDDLPWRVPAFKALVKQLDRHVAAFAKELDFDLGGKKLRLDSLWINVLPPGGIHTSHIHPLSVISGTYYVRVPDGASAIKFEDPRHAMMMAAPPRKKKGKPDQQPFVYQAPQPGTLLLWESWLRHEVPLNRGEEERISVSFNYSWG